MNQPEQAPRTGRDAGRLPGQPRGVWSHAVPPLVELIGAPLALRLHATWRIERVGYDNIRTVSARPGWIVGSFHDAILLTALLVRERGTVSVISPSWEGEIIARLVHRFGHRIARGSSGHQPLRAVRESVRQLRRGRVIAWAVDGPIGPPRVVKPGIAQIASLTGRPIVPMHGVADRAWVLPSWDRHVIPKPFARVATGFGEPVYVPRGVRGADLERWTVRVRDSLLALEDELRGALARRVTGWE